MPSVSLVSFALLMRSDRWVSGHSMLSKFLDGEPSYLGVSGLSRLREERAWEREDTEDLPREGEFGSDGSRWIVAEKG